MTVRELMYLYDNWNGIVVINDDNLKRIVKGTGDDIMYCVAFLEPDASVGYAKLLRMEVVAFGFYDGELCIRVK